MELNWVILQLDSIPTINGMDKVISKIYYKAQKEYQEDVIHFMADQYGVLSVDAPHEANFTPYNEVTKEIIKGWLESLLDTKAIEVNLDKQIDDFLNPPIIAYPLPWL